MPSFEVSLDAGWEVVLLAHLPAQVIGLAFIVLGVQLDFYNLPWLSAF